MKTQFLFEDGPFGSYKKSAASGSKAIIDNTKKALNKQLRMQIYKSKFVDVCAPHFVEMFEDVNKSLATAWRNMTSSDENGLWPKIASPARITGICEAAGEVSNLLEIDFQTAVKNIYLDPSYIINGHYKNEFIIPIYVHLGYTLLNPLKIVELYSFLDNALPTISKKVSDKLKKVSKVVEELGVSQFSFEVPKNIKFAIYPSFEGGSTLFNGTYEKPSYLRIPTEIAERCRQTDIYDITSIRKSPILHEMMSSVKGLKLNGTGVCGGLCVRDHEMLKRIFSLNREYLVNSPIIEVSYIDLLVSDILNEHKALKVIDEFLGLPFVEIENIQPSTWNRSEHVRIIVPNCLKEYSNILTAKSKLKNYPNLSNLGLYVNFRLNDVEDKSQSYNSYSGRDIQNRASIGKQLTPAQAENEGISLSALKRRVYVLDQNDPTVCKKAANDIINALIGSSGADCQIDAVIKKEMQDKLPAFISSLMNKVIAAKPHCATSNGKLLLCDYTQNSNTDNIRALINSEDITFNEKKNVLSVKIALDFKLPVAGVNPNYTANLARGVRQNSGKHYEYITGKKLKIDIKL